MAHTATPLLALIWVLPQSRRRAERLQVAYLRPFANELSCSADGGGNSIHWFHLVVLPDAQALTIKNE
eukprot:scaffold130188_cov28-Tisochrysis_lutea.AAC.5